MDEVHVGAQGLELGQFDKWISTHLLIPMDSVDKRLRLTECSKLKISEMLTMRTRKNLLNKLTG